MAVCTVVILFDVILLRRGLLSLLRKVDWNVLLMFAGLFIWLEGFNRTRIPRLLWDTFEIGNLSALFAQWVRWKNFWVHVNGKP